MVIRKKPSRDHERKKESRDATLLKGTEDLLALGWDLESLEPTVASVSRLSGLRPPSREAEQAIACWLGFVELPESVAQLSRMERVAEDKELKREIRRSLFRLEQHGMAIPATPAPDAREGVLAREKDRGYFSPVDGSGDQVVWYVREEGSGDYFILSGVLNDRRGLVEADAGRVARPALRGILEETRRRFSLRLLPGDAAWSDLVLHEAYRSSAERRSRGVEQFPTYRMEISHRAPEKVPCPVLSALDAGSVREDALLLESSERILEEPELSAWTLDRDWMAPHLSAHQEAQDSPLVLNRYQTEERLERMIRTAAVAIFGGEARTAYARRLQAMAYYFHLAGRPDPARRALALSLALGDEADAGGRGGLPFALALTRRSFAREGQAERLRAREEKRTSLIVRPGEP